MIDFGAEIAAFATKVEQGFASVHNHAVNGASTSIVHGSAVTGSPGQPVSGASVPEAGKLRDSWETSRDSRWTATIATDVGYAPTVEDNPNGVAFETGGPHSVRLTVAGWGDIVRVAVTPTGFDGEDGG